MQCAWFSMAWAFAFVRRRATIPALAPILASMAIQAPTMQAHYSSCSSTADPSHDQKHSNLGRVQGLRVAGFDVEGITSSDNSLWVFRLIPPDRVTRLQPLHDSRLESTRPCANHGQCKNPLCFSVCGMRILAPVHDGAFSACWSIFPVRESARYHVWTNILFSCISYARAHDTQSSGIINGASSSDAVLTRTRRNWIAPFFRMISGAEGSAKVSGSTLREVEKHVDKHKCRNSFFKLACPINPQQSRSRLRTALQRHVFWSQPHRDSITRHPCGARMGH